MLLRNKIKCLPKILVYSILIVIFCCSCSAETDSGAKSVVDGYCKEIQNYDLEASKEYLASKSSEYNVYISTNIYSAFEDFFKENASKIEYTIIDEEIDSSDQTFDDSHVTVNFSYLDASEAMEAAVTETLIVLSNSDIDDDLVDDEYIGYLILDNFENYVSQNELSKVDKTVQFFCMRNKNKQSPQWFINSIPDEISYILTCNTEVAFEDYETKYSELISQTENVDSYDDNTLSYGAQLGFWIPEEEDIKYLAYAGRYVNDYGEELGISMYTSLDEGSTVGLVSYDNCEGKLVDCGDGWYMIDETGSDYDGWKLSGYITADGNISMTMFYYNDYTGTYSFYCDFTMVEQYVS